MVASRLLRFDPAVIMTANLKNVDLNLLVIFEAIYSSSNISRASERLGMSQPAVSNALARLRQSFDDPLFIRCPKGVAPTLKARELISPVREALGLIGRHLPSGTAFDPASYKRIFRVVVADPLEPLIMPALVDALVCQAPGIAVECVQGHPRLFDEMRAGTLDLVCYSFPVDMTDIVYQPICRADLVVVSRRNHPQIKKPLDLATFSKLPHIALSRELRGMTEIDKGLASGSASRHVAYMASKVWSMPPMIERTDLIGILPRVFVNAIAVNFQLDVHELPIEIPVQHFFMAWNVSANLDQGHIWLRELLMQAAHDAVRRNEN
jgi:DNA-binding transcriptional LysR family regulator